MIGGLLVKFAFVACLASIVNYFLYHRRPDPRILTAARIFFHATVVSVLVAAAYLLYLILTHQFQYTYIWSYSSRELPLPLLISTFYAGQEGSFMLWTLFTAIIGVFLSQHAARKGYEPEVMGVFGMILASLILMMVAKNPFEYVWNSWPGQVAEGFVPVNGRGLNPLLQNYWMVIHPQVLFSGFAAMSVPYAYALAALIKRDYNNWIRPATPWLVFAATILGTGIMMGGFWAYETLGWGGYWGWDPVENSSLVPWLVAIGGIHMTLSQRRTGGFKKTNLILGMLCFIMVLYSTFLTRSGVLGDTSVHSFVDPGMLVYWLLIGIIALFVGLAIFMLVRRWKDIPATATHHHYYYSREFALFLGACLLVAAALFIVVGTSSPIITDILYGTKSAVDISYYVTTTLPIGIMVGILAGLGQLLWWNRSRKEDLFKSLRWPIGLSTLTAFVFTAVIGAELLVGLFVFGAAFALFANIAVGWRLMKGNPKFAGGSVAHIGLAVMFLGFVASSKYDAKETLSLKQGQPTKSLGYTLTYTGYRPIDQEKYAFQVSVERQGKQYTIAPVMYYSSYNDGLMRNPDILNMITKDFYLAPLALEQRSDTAQQGVQKVMLQRGVARKVGTLEITFVDFELPDAEKGAMVEGKDMRIGARLMVKESGGKPQAVVPAKLLKEGSLTDQPAMLGNAFEFVITGMSPDRESREHSSVEIGVRNVARGGETAQPEPDVLVVEASVKPYINMVWSGVIILLVGFVVTIVRRAQDATHKRSMVAEPAAGVNVNYGTGETTPTPNR
ncbi:MAG: ccmF [Bacteroidetes bacterium]|nr:ccmF [Bacteroidota bacterium]